MANTIRILAMLEASSVTGSAKAVLEFAREAIQKDSRPLRVEVSVMTFSRSQAENGLTTAFRSEGIPLDVVFERGRFDWGVIPQLRALVEKRRADLIWSNSVKSHFLVRSSGLNRSRTWIAFHHGYTAEDMKMRAYNQLDRWSLRGADRVVTSSTAFAEELKRRHIHSNRIHVQHMPIRPFQAVPDWKIADLRCKLRLDVRTRVLLSIGRLSPEKGHVDLIRVFPKIRELLGPQPLHLVLLGEGPERPRIEELCRNLGLNDAVTLTGQQDDVNPYYAIADVFVLPSHSEGSPNVLLESIAAGTPVVATAVGGVPELVGHEKEALLVRQNDAPALAAAVAQVLRDQVLRDRLVAEASKIVLQKTPGAYFESMVSVFSTALQHV